MRCGCRNGSLDGALPRLDAAEDGVGMIAITKPKKRADLTVAEKKELKYARGLLKALKRAWGKTQACGDYHPECPACKHYVFMGMLEWHIAELEY